jgi:HEPN domain-containing protein
MSGKDEEIKQWIIKGDHDLGTAKITYLHIPEYLDTVTFHCQQAVEKYLKSYLIFQSTEFRLTHDLIYLLDMISQKDSDFENYYDIVSELQGYAIEIRYPNETIFLSNDKVEKALTIAKEVRNLITKKMNIDIDYNEIIDS